MWSGEFVNEEERIESDESSMASSSETSTQSLGEESSHEGDAVEKLSEGTSDEVVQRRLSQRTDLKWYIIHCYSGLEHKAKASLEERIVQLGAEDSFAEILIPTENVVELVKGQKKTSQRKFFPGYMLVKMEITDETWHIIKGTHRITGFVGNARKPPPVPEREVLRITEQMQEGAAKAKPKFDFREGDQVRVVDGPFTNFNGTVEEVNIPKNKLKVLVSIFGRATPVELDFLQVERS